MHVFVLRFRVEKLKVGVNLQYDHVTKAGTVDFTCVWTCVSACVCCVRVRKTSLRPDSNLGSGNVYKTFAWCPQSLRTPHALTHAFTHVQTQVKLTVHIACACAGDSRKREKTNKLGESDIIVYSSVYRPYNWTGHYGNATGRHNHHSMEAKLWETLTSRSVLNKRYLQIHPSKKNPQKQWKVQSIRTRAVATVHKNRESIHKGK